MKEQISQCVHPQALQADIPEISRLIFKEVDHILKKVAPTGLPVLIQGETGTGKELMSWAIHYHSQRRDKPYLAFNSGAVPETLIESELFGHTKGAFTSASETKKGYIELASEGTLFIDEIGNMPLSMQQKLLRILEDKQLWPVGSEKTVTVNTRFIFASNQNIEELVSRKLFREDLFYRINIITISLPALRERHDDISLFARYFLKRHFKENAVPKISPKAMDILSKHCWPGNIRELENEIKRIYVFYPDTKIITESMLSESIRNCRSLSPLPCTPRLSLRKTMENTEKMIILDALKKNHNNISRTAQSLKLNRCVLYDKVRRLKIKCE
ncbi:MAG: sigma-54 dependent transcriptional regulator [Candidatus Brocadiia bacterium]